MGSSRALKGPVIMCVAILIAYEPQIGMGLGSELLHQSLDPEKMIAQWRSEVPRGEGSDVISKVRRLGLIEDRVAPGNQVLQKACFGEPP